MVRTARRLRTLRHSWVGCLCCAFVLDFRFSPERAEERLEQLREILQGSELKESEQSPSSSLQFPSFSPSDFEEFGSSSAPRRATPRGEGEVRRDGSRPGGPGRCKDASGAKRQTLAELEVVTSTFELPFQKRWGRFPRSCSKASHDLV